MKKRNKLIFRYSKILIIIGLMIASLYIWGYFSLKRDLKYRINFNKSDIYYTYDAGRKLEVIYGVRFHNEIDHLLDYYDWKLYGKEYIYGDVSKIGDLPNNTIVYAQKYVRDSSIVYVAFKHYNTYKKDSVTWNYFIPKTMLHKIPLVGSGDAVGDSLSSAGYVN